MKQRLNKNRTSQEDINILQQFIGKVFLFLNESLMRFVATSAIIKSIANTSDIVKRDENL
jgi:hypothetical protein